MVMVKQPFLSGWASGSIAKIITCRALFNNRFCMHKFRHTQHKRSPAQLWYQDRFARKVWLGFNAREVGRHRSAVLGLSWLGISTLGATEPLAEYLNKIPPFVIEEE